MAIPTLKELNDMSCSDVSLLILRCLSTSDLTYMCALLKKETNEDIANVCMSLIDAEMVEDSAFIQHYAEAKELSALITE